jgi:flavin-dependent dehydrogenase
VTAALTTDVCVIGGGPAGATIARRLAQVGHQVCLIAHPPTARHHVSESLAPNIEPLLDVLGLSEQVDRAGFGRTAGSYLHWGQTAQYRPWPDGAGYHVDRRVFDDILLNAARQAGVRVLAPARARRPCREDGRWRVPIATGRSHRAIEATFLVIATGKDALLRGSGVRYSEPTLALAARFAGLKSGDDESRVEAGAEEWTWGTWSKNGTAEVIAFLDPRRARCGGAELVQVYRRVVAGLPFWGTVTAGATHSRVRACNAASVAFGTPVTAQMVRVGDASFSADPLSSQGVHGAMLSAIQASTAVHTILRDPDNADAAIEFYTARQREAVSQHQAWAADCYAAVAADEDASDFWRKRARRDTQFAPKDLAPHPTRAWSALTRVRLAPELVVLPTPVITDERITRMDGVHHPRLSRPVVFLGGVQLAPLLARLDPGRTLTDVLHLWKADVSAVTALAILEWLNDRGLIECSDGWPAVLSEAAPPG